MEKLKSLLNNSGFFVSKIIVPVISASIAVTFINMFMNGINI